MITMEMIKVVFLVAVIIVIVLFVSQFIRDFFKKGKTDSINRLIVALSVSVFLFCCYTSVCLLQSKNELNELHTAVMNIDNMLITQQSNPDALQAAMAFMERETDRFRLSIEHQQNTLLTLIGMAVVGVGGMLGFLGFKSKTDVEQITKEHIEKNMDSAIANQIGGAENLEYLKLWIEDEKVAREKSILYIENEHASEFSNSLTKSINEIKKQMHLHHVIPKKKSDFPIDEIKEKLQAGKFEVIIYGVPQGDGDYYLKVIQAAEAIKPKSPICIIYAAQKVTLNTDDYPGIAYKATSKGALIERLTTAINLKEPISSS